MNNKIASAHSDDTIEVSRTDAREQSFADRLISHIDRAVRTLHPGVTQATRENPAKSINNLETLSASEQKHAAGLMRINHTGEVCAQALYSGQSLTAKSNVVRAEMLESALEEEDHLAWCEEQLNLLKSKPSVLNPIFYAGSFAMGALAGLAGDKFSLGFIEATEDRVCQHLQNHLSELPQKDLASRAIVSKMIEDENSHGQKALAAGGERFTEAQKNVMASLSKIMTRTTYHL